MFIFKELRILNRSRLINEAENGNLNVYDITDFHSIRVLITFSHITFLMENV